MNSLCDSDSRRIPHITMPPRTDSSLSWQHKYRGLLGHISLTFKLAGLLYVLLLALLATPFFQKHVLFLHQAKFPLFAKLDVPERYGLALGKTLNLNLKTSDNVTLGAWFILSDAYHQSLPLHNPPASRFPKEHIPSALTFHPTIIFFHGNAATRAASYRVGICAAFSSRLHANVLAIDYRGFGDSQGHPTETGLAFDARAAWDWVVGHGARPEDVLIVGHSLGTAVAARLSSELSGEGVRFKGTVLLAPFSSITTLMDAYNILGFLPITKPLTMIPGGFRLISWAVVSDFNTKELISSINAPIFIVHAENDWIVPTKHSQILFDALLEPLLTPLSLNLESPNSPAEELTELVRIAEERKEQRSALVAKLSIPSLGSLEEFVGHHGWRVVLLKPEVGGHQYIGTLESVHDIMRRVFRF